MSSSYKSPSNPEPKGERSTIDSWPEITAETPEQFSMGRSDVKRRIKSNIGPEDDYVLAAKVSPDARMKLGQLVQVGAFHTTAEAAVFLLDEGIKSQSPLLERVKVKLAEIERLRAELRGLIREENATDNIMPNSSDTSMRTKDNWDQTDPHWLVGPSAEELGTGLLLVKESGSNKTKKINKPAIGYHQFRAFAELQDAIAIKWVPHSVADETTILNLKCHGYCQVTCVRPGCICDSNHNECG